MFAYNNAHRFCKQEADMISAFAGSAQTGTSLIASLDAVKQAMQE